MRASCIQFRLSRSLSQQSQILSSRARQLVYTVQSSCNLCGILPCIQARTLRTSGKCHSPLLGHAWHMSDPSFQCPCMPIPRRCYMSCTSREPSYSTCFLPLDSRTWCSSRGTRPESICCSTCIGNPTEPILLATPQERDRRGLHRSRRRPSVELVSVCCTLKHIQYACHRPKYGRIRRTPHHSC